MLLYLLYVPGVRSGAALSHHALPRSNMHSEDGAVILSSALLYFFHESHQALEAYKLPSRRR